MVAISKSILLVFSVIIGGIVIIFGTKALFFVGGQMSETSFDDFVIQLERDLIKYRSSYKQVEIVEYTLPKKYQKVCFADLSLTGTESFQNAIDDPIVFDAVMSGAANVIVYKGDTFERTLLVDGLTVLSDKGYMCVNNNGLLKLSFEGIKDDRVLVSRGEY